MIAVPFTNYPDFTEDVSFDGTLYSLRFRWNTRGLFWTVDVATRSGELLICGAKLCINMDTFGRYNRVALPQGIVFPFRVDSSSNVIAEDEVGNTVTIGYIEEAELA